MNLRQLEFWVATLLVTVSLSASLAWMDGAGQASVADVRREFWNSGLRFNYVMNYFLPHILPALFYYGGFLAVMFLGYPRFFETKRNDAFITFLLGVLGAMTLLFAFNTFLGSPGYSENYTGPERLAGRLVTFFSRGLIMALQFMALITAYILIRVYVIPALMSRSKRSLKAQSFMTHFQAFLFIWVPAIAAVFFVRRDALDFMIFVAFCALPLAFLVHALNYNWLIPYREQKRLSWWKYWALYLILSFAMCVPVVLVFEATIGSVSFDPGAVLVVTYIWILVLVTPLTWILYLYGRKTTGRLNQLASALSTSNANLDFLKSQINPHFLFNALNTLYGTAIQERSENTAQGIQKLGDMMRFMLFDNMQDGIPLIKEIQYMRNYIDLQKLRTQASDKIRIDTMLEEAGCQHTVAPMLLIPFVENAFKHGISLIRPSWIKVSLTCTPDKVYFDVYNSVHPSPEKDPEENSSGIGLENVRQRLQLLYPGRHELSIHQSQTEYFIHLTLLFPHGR
ncbi:sensor histidine kinase [Dinghuibacter silviterrae]|uniref:Histidine kinase n=1 Tax=Dinghuibacter silviterrae TaxID=1539049 RepID=A0A4R8DG19_9BACT|nr:histidine kinase [Dinghuibacter silviterrae]TDW96559.1 histidine kinase [Dinghuibacter silviterrae]